MNSNDTINQKIILANGSLKTIGILNEMYHKRSIALKIPSNRPNNKAENPRAKDSARNMLKTPHFVKPILRIIPISLSICSVESKILTN